jgi:hypothetical protein
MFELGVRRHPPRALYRSYLAQSEVFVSIYSQRYGWWPRHGHLPAEDESDGMPRLNRSQVAGTRDRAPARADDGPAQDENSAPYRPFREPAEFHDLLLDDLAVPLTERFGQRMSVECRSD